MRIIKPVILIAPLAALVVGGPLFEENRGQFSSNVRFLANNGAVSVAITDSGIAFRGYGGEIRLRMDSARMNGCRPDSEKKSEANYLALNPPVASVPRYTSVIAARSIPASIGSFAILAGRSNTTGHSRRARSPRAYRFCSRAGRPRRSTEAGIW